MAVAHRDIVRAVELMINLDVIGVDPFVANGDSFVVGLQAGECRRRQERQQLAGNRADAGGRYDFVREWLAVRAVRIAAGGIGDGRWRVGENALTEGHRGNGDAVDIAAEIARALKIAEEECPVAPDRAADCEAELVIYGVR